jgi:hypothetical protein
LLPECLDLRLPSLNFNDLPADNGTEFAFHIGILGEIKMGNKSAIIVLTLVVFSLVSPRVVWADLSTTGADLDDCSTAKQQMNDAKNALAQYKNDKTVSPASTQAQTDYSSRVSDYNTCKSDLKSKCADGLKEFKDIQTKMGNYTNVAKAKSCMGLGNSDDDNQGAEMVAAAVAGQVSTSPSPGCDFGGAKTSNKETRDKYQSDVDKLSDKIRKSGDDIIKKEKSTQEQLDDINKQRQDLKEQFEDNLDQAQSAQTKAASALRDKQMQIANQIRQLQSAEITARQNIQNTSIEQRNALTSAKDGSDTVDLTSESALQLHCIALMKKTNADYYGGKASNSNTAGASRVSILKDFYNKCVDRMHDLRTTVNTGYQNSLEQRVKQHDDVSQQLAEAQQSYTQSTTDYNTSLDQLKSKMTRAQTNYYTKDNQLSNKYNTLLHQAQQTQYQDSMNRLQDQQTLTGKIKSQGTLSTDDAQEIEDNFNTLQKTYDAYHDSCQSFQGIPSPSAAESTAEDRAQQRKDNSSNQ